MRSRMPQAIWALGLVSLFMDVSSEMIHGLLPIFVVGTLGASAFALGLMEGVAEAVASVLKLPSGWLSDRWRRRKPLALAGYGLAALVKPLFAVAPSLGWVFAARLLDRAGKGIRGAPRDALVADLAPRGLHGAAFGLRQALDTIGAFAGPLIAIAIMMLSGDDVRLVFWLAVPPAILSVILLWVLVPDAPASPPREPAPQSVGAAAAPASPGLGLAGMGGPFWGAIALTALFTLGRYSEAFLVLRAQERGLPLTLAPLVLVGMNVVYSLAAYPAGGWSDRLGRRGLLLVAALIMAAADALLAAAEELTLVAAGVVLWGLHMAFSQGVLTALIADTAPPERRGTAFGIFHLTSGIALLAASAGSGFLWTSFGPPAAFLAGLGVALLSALAISCGAGRAPQEAR
jgi:MFS family permease